MNTLADEMHPKMERNDDTAIITLVGGKIRDAEDMIAAELETLTNDLDMCHLLLDFTNIVNLGSAELGTLLGLNRRMKTAGGRLTLFNLNPRIFEVFQVGHLQMLLEICRERRSTQRSAPSLPREGPSAVIVSKNEAWFRCPHCQRDWEVRITDEKAKIVPSAHRILQCQIDAVQG